MREESGIFVLKVRLDKYVCIYIYLIEHNRYFLST